MLGDQIGSMESATVNKTLTAEGALPKFEVSATGAGQLCGVDVTSIATYIAQMRSGGAFFRLIRWHGFESRTSTRIVIRHNIC